MTTLLECPSCKRHFELEELPASGVFTCNGCGRSMVLRSSRHADAAENLLARLLIDEGLITDAQLADAKRTRDQGRDSGRGVSLSQVLVEKNLVTRNQIEETLESAGGPTTVMIPGYEILEELGKGGMGTVFKAVHLASGKAVAIKVLAPRLARQKDFLKRFHREARVAIELDHPHIVKGYDEGVAGSTHYFVMEYVEGKSAERVLRKRQRFGERRAMDIVRQLAQALQHAHSRGLIHRDIKPDNIILTRDGTAKLADYGLVKMADDPAMVGLTASGQIMGTPHYIAPEQVAGERQIDIRSDIYSLGATLYHMVTGTTPYTGKSGAETMSMHLYGRLEDPRERHAEVSEEAARLIMTMMARAREDRFQTPRRLLDAIEEYVRGQRGAGASDLAAEPAWAESDAGAAAVRRPRSPRQRLLAAAGGAALLLSLAVLAGVLWSGRPAALPPADWLGARGAREAEALLEEARSLSGGPRLALLQRLAREHPRTEAGMAASVQLWQEMVGGDSVSPPARRAAALEARLAAAPTEAGRRALLRRLATRYGETPAGARARQRLAALEAAEEEARRRREQALARREAEAEARREQEARERAAATELEVAELVRETPELYEKKLAALVGNDRYAGTEAAAEARRRLAALREAMAEARRREEARARAAARREAIGSLHQEVVKALARQRPADMGEAVAAFLADEDFARFRPAAEPYVRDWERFGTMSRALLEGLQAYVNTPVRLRLERGETLIGDLGQVQGKTFTVLSSGGTEMERDIRALHPEEKIKYAAHGFEGEAWERRLMLGLYRLSRGDLEGAREDLRAAGEADPHAEHHRELFRDVAAYIRELQNAE